MLACLHGPCYLRQSQDHSPELKYKVKHTFHTQEPGGVRYDATPTKGAQGSTTEHFPGMDQRRSPDPNRPIHWLIEA